jgi:hypothetical protein
MGYRSDVTLVFYTRLPSDVPFAALKLWFDENYPVKDAEFDWGAKVTSNDCDYVMVEYTDVKWYAGYDHPQAVDAAIEKFDETFDATGTDNVAYEMVRVGEETADIEQRYSEYCDWRLGVSREIEFQ